MKKKKDSGQVMFTIRLSDEMNDAVNKIATTMDRPRGFIVREAIAYYLATQRAK